MEEVDLFVIGGGSAGMKTARTVARTGYKVAVAEAKETGGECFWAGCIPTKALLRAASVWQLVREASEFGMHTGELHGNFADAMGYKKSIMQKLAGDSPKDAGLSKLGALYFNEKASFESANEIRVGNQVIKARKILIATGTDPSIPPIPGLEEAGYITNREAVDLEHLPKQIAVIGGGPIGLEFSQIFHRFGATVTVIESSSHVLPREDSTIAMLAQESIIRQGIAIKSATSVKSISKSGNCKTLVLQTAMGEERLECDEILISTGRVPATKGLNLAAAGFDDDGKALTVNLMLQTSVPNIYAAGDVTGGYQFTHVASYMGGVAAMNMFGSTPRLADTRVLPRCTYIDPEVASVGITELEAKAANIPIRVQCALYSDLDKPVLYNRTDGIVKLIISAVDDQILGAHILGDSASSIISEIAVCMQNRLPVQAIANTMHAFPSFPEVVEAAALSKENC